jgi:heptosyltransferase-2
MKIALFLPNWIGDAVMATPAVRALREHFHGGHLIGIVRPYVAGVLEGSPWLDELIFLDTKGRWSRRWPAVAAQLRRYGVDLAVLFPNSFRSAFVAWAGRCRSRVGYARADRSWLLTRTLEPVCDARGRRRPSPAILDYNRLTEAVGCPAPSRRMELFTTPRDEAAADAVWQRAGLAGYSEVVCLNPGAAFGAAKYWPVEYFAALARQLVDRRGGGVLVLCGPAERELARSIAKQAQHPAVHALAEYTALGKGTVPLRREGQFPFPTLSIGLSKACVRRADLLITTDSGPRHFAAAFDRPVVTLFGPTHIAWTETYHPKAIHLQKVVDCGPCQRRVCPLDHRCMKLLTPAEVFDAAAELLAIYPRSAAAPSAEPDAPARTSRASGSCRP